MAVSEITVLSPMNVVFAPGGTITVTVKVTSNGVPLNNAQLQLFVVGSGSLTGGVTGMSGEAPGTHSFVFNPYNAGGGLLYGPSFGIYVRFDGIIWCPTQPCPQNYDVATTPTITASNSGSPSCRSDHPTSQCLNDYVWDCVGESWQNTSVFCGIVPPTCREEHPTSQCINGFTWDCVSGEWVNTTASCGAVPCRTTHPASQCIDGYIWDCNLDNQWVNTAEICNRPALDLTPLYIVGGVIGVIGLGLLLARKKK